VIGLDIGLVKGQLVVARTRAGLPAHRAGLQRGDRIIEVDGAATAGLTRKQAAARIGGPAGTHVSLVVERPGTPGTLRFDLTREVAPEATPLPPGTGRTMLGLVALVGGIAVAVTLFSSWSDDHRDAADAYTQDLREGDTRAAYGRLAGARQHSISYETWMAAMNTPLLMRATVFRVGSTRKESTGRGCVRGAVVVDGSDVHLTVYTVEEHGQVRIHSVITHAEENRALGTRLRPWEC
jgi:membrane-associated protease RseP (regulator of RpoE activity)